MSRHQVARSREVSSAVVSLLLLLAAPRAARAQDTTRVDPMTEEASEYFEPEKAFTLGNGFDVFGDVRIRGERVSHLPGGRDDVERARGSLRPALRWTPHFRVTAEAGFRANQGSDRNQDNRINFDNEESDGTGLDRASLRLGLAPGVSLTAGKTELPLWLSALVWDEDLRPWGASVTGRWSLFEFDVMRITAGSWADDRLERSKTLLGAGQLAWLWREGAETGGEALLAYMDWYALGPLAAEGFGRQNSVLVRDPLFDPVPRLAADFRMIDVQVGVRHALAGIPCALRVDLVRNLEAERESDGARVRLAAGDTEPRWGLEVGYVLQRIERDTVLGAFNSDDWWFHSRARGHSGWLALGLGEQIVAKISGFWEQRDDLQETTQRLTLDVTARLGRR